jgi:putative membrane protein
MTIRNWGFAAGLAAALALVGTAEAGTAKSDTTSSSGSTGSSDPAYGSAPSGTAPGSTSTGTSATPGATGTSETAAGSMGSTAQAGQKMDKDLKEKIQKIHASNKAEIHMAQIGAERAQSPEVKQFAETLQRDHQQLDEKLTAAAQSAGVELEGKDYEKKHERAMKDMGNLEKKSGQEFDREFMSHMVKDHEKDLKDVKSAARDAEKGNHTELAAVLNQAERGMQGHKDQAEQLRDSLKSGTQAQGRTGSMGSTGAEAGSTGTGTGADAGSTGAAQPGAQDTKSGGAQGTSSDRVGERGGDTGQSRGTQEQPAAGSENKPRY